MITVFRAIFTVSLLVLCTGNGLALCVPTTFGENWLQLQEDLGGHTIARHVGKSDMWLVNRLQKSSRISAASSYPDTKTATTSIHAALQFERTSLNQWVLDAPVGATRAIDHVAKAIVGRIALRPPRMTNIVGSSNLRAVVRTMTGGTCFLLTSYPVR